MKPTLLFLVWLWLLATSQLRAQEPSPTPVVLPKPILAKLPAMASWTITSVERRDQAGKDGKSKSSKLTASGKKVFIKAEHLLQVIKADAEGHQMHQWRVGNTQYLVSPGSADVGVMDPTSDEYIKGDFQNLEWIKESNFAGMETFQGRECWVFKDRVLHATRQEIEDAKARAADDGTSFDENTYYVEEIAYVDSKTQLPVVVQEGEVLYAYAFGTPPGVLTPPSNIQHRVEADEQRDKAMKAGPPRPF
jgi:hypothetical protein